MALFNFRIMFVSVFNLIQICDKIGKEITERRNRLMEKEKVFVVGDVHGQITMMEKILTYWNPNEEQLIFLGDLADRGENSKATLELAYDLMNTHDAIIIKGNHDEMLENFLEYPEIALTQYYMNGGEKTVDALLNRETKGEDLLDMVAEIKEKYPWLLPVLKSLPLYYEWGDYLFVHAGVDMQQEHWQDSSKRYFVWIREGFYDQANTTNKKIFFGHTVTSTLHSDGSGWEIWQSGDGLYGIDGGAVYGGKLHGVVLSKTDIIQHYSV